MAVYNPMDFGPRWMLGPEYEALKAKADAFDRVLRIGDTEDDELPEDAISKIAEVVTDYYAAKARLER